jgi:hypothetical protein
MIAFCPSRKELEGVGIYGFIDTPVQQCQRTLEKLQLLWDCNSQSRAGEEAGLAEEETKKIQGESHDRKMP